MMHVSYNTLCSRSTKTISPGKIQGLDVATNGAFRACDWGHIPTAVAVRHNLIQMVPRKMRPLNSLPIGLSLFPELLNLSKSSDVFHYCQSSPTNTDKYIRKRKHNYSHSPGEKAGKVTPHTLIPLCISTEIKQLSKSLVQLFYFGLVGKETSVVAKRILTDALLRRKLHTYSMHYHSF